LSHANTQVAFGELVGDIETDSSVPVKKKGKRRGRNRGNIKKKRGRHSLGTIGNSNVFHNGNHIDTTSFTLSLILSPFSLTLFVFFFKYHRRTLFAPVRERGRSRG
jgi:hypothetical protein